MKKIWNAIYGQNEITIRNSWFEGEELLVNNQLQDKSLNILTPSKLTGHLLENGEKKYIKANIYSGIFSVQCNLFIDDKPLPLKEIK